VDPSRNVPGDESVIGAPGRLSPYPGKGVAEVLDGVQIRAVPSACRTAASAIRTVAAAVRWAATAVRSVVAAVSSAATAL
jgi:hypothetical protein